MKKIIFYLSLVIVVLVILLFTYIDLNKKHKAESKRHANNYIEVQKTVKELNLTVSEFKKNINAKTDSILKETRIKPKNITKVTTYNNKYIDTTIVVKKPEYDDKTGLYPFVDKEGCFEFSGFMFIKDEEVLKPELIISERKFNQDLTEIEHFEKDTIYFLGLRAVKWWQKKRKVTTYIDNCTGKKYIEKINIK